MRRRPLPVVSKPEEIVSVIDYALLLLTSATIAIQENRQDLALGLVSDAIEKCERAQGKLHGNERARRLKNKAKG